MEKVKFTQLYWFDGSLFGLDDEGQVWVHLGVGKEWKQLLSAYREHTPAKSEGRVVVPPTPEQLKIRNERDFEKAISSVDTILDKHKNP